MLRAFLEHACERRQVIGYCRWGDGDGLLFGRVLSLDATRVFFGLIDPDGRRVEEEGVALSSISRVEQSLAYIRRLRLFGTLEPRPKESDGQSTKTRATLNRWLRDACKTGECLSLTRKKEDRQDFRVRAIDRTFVQLEEYGDDPRVVVNTMVVRYEQIIAIRRRSTSENAVTLVWKANEKKATSRARRTKSNRNPTRSRGKKSE